MTIMMTSAVNHDVAGDEAFAKFVDDSLARFNRNDWGDTHKDDWPLNDQAIAQKNDRALARYNLPLTIAGADRAIYICAEFNPEQGRWETTIMFTSEY